MISLPVLPADQARRLTPTDVTLFVRLEQCERFLRLRLAERAGQDFMKEYDVIPQRMTPLLSLSGHTFEEGIEADLAKRTATVNYAAKYAKAHNRPENNNEVVDEVRKLSPGSPSFCCSLAWKPNSAGGGCGAMWTSCDWTETRTAHFASSSAT